MALRLSPAEKRGAHREDKFFRAARKKTKQTPWWFRSVRRASPGMDVRGIDGFVKVKIHPDQKAMSVPIQIKSSASGKYHYAVKHPLNLNAGVVVLIISEEMTDDEIRHMLYSELGKVRSLSREHFQEFLEKLLERGLRPNGKKIKQMIVTQRAQKKKR